MKIVTDKIKSIIYSSKFILILWFSYLASPLISVVRFNYILKNSDSFLFIIRAFFSLAQRFFFVGFALMVLALAFLWFGNFLNGKIDRKRFLVFLTLLTTSLIYNVFSSLLLGLERSHYANYLYSQYGLLPSQLEFISTVNVLVIGLSASFIFIKTAQLAGRQNTAVRRRGLRHDSFIQIQKLVFMLGFMLLAIFTFQTLVSLPQLIVDARQGYQQKLGRHYIYIEALKKVPQDSVVIHPPQGSEWPAVGNQPVLRYFLYPRTLISGALLENNDALGSIDKAYFVFIPEDGHAPDWPAFNFDKNTVIFNGKDYVSYSKLTKTAENPDLYYIEF